MFLGGLSSNIDFLAYTKLKIQDLKIFIVYFSIFPDECFPPYASRSPAPSNPPSRPTSMPSCSTSFPSIRVGTVMPTIGPPGWWPARPIRRRRLDCTPIRIRHSRAKRSPNR